ncbi:unnamed protein product [Miscanthus lutarioriparius]|uniref:Uncharacterized protein n=1 Tax=Miscanthus lutarioriparius TaxID=422564 RepID=A0A811MTQ0_9POAL|nr:unnamed protein product [Miscanthus lutarioriparius]
MKRHGKRLDHEERKRKREAREVHRRSKDARNLLGAKGCCSYVGLCLNWLFCSLKMHDESTKRQKVDDDVQEGALPPYLLDRDQTHHAKVLSNTIKQKRKEKAGKWDLIRSRRSSGEIDELRKRSEEAEEKLARTQKEMEEYKKLTEINNKAMEENNALLKRILAINNASLT